MEHCCSNALVVKQKDEEIKALKEKMEKETEGRILAEAQLKDLRGRVTSLAYMTLAFHDSLTNEELSDENMKVTDNNEDSEISEVDINIDINHNDTSFDTFLRSVDPDVVSEDGPSDPERD